MDGVAVPGDGELAAHPVAVEDDAAGRALDSDDVGETFGDQPVPHTAIADRVLVVDPGVRLRLRRRRHVAPSGGESRIDRCGGAVALGICESGGQSGDRLRFRACDRIRQRGETVRGEECSVRVARKECGMPQDVDQQVAIRADAVDLRSHEGLRKQPRSLRPGRCVGDHLGEHRVVVDPHVRSVDDTRIQTDPAAAQDPELGVCSRNGDPTHDSRLRLPVVSGIFRIEADLDRMSMHRGRLGIESATGSDMQLQIDQVETGHALGDGVLDLQTGVHLEEVELPRFTGGEELDGARAFVTDGFGGAARSVEQILAHAGDHADEWRRRFLDDFLMSALDGAFPLTDGPHGAVPIGEDLHLDMPTGFEVALAEHRRIAERRVCLAAGGLELRG